MTIQDILEKLNVTVKSGNPNFAEQATTDETSDGLYTLEDDDGPSYYYRGAVTNNYLQFGQNAKGKDLFWRIIRINGNGSLRIIYEGTRMYESGSNSESAFLEHWINYRSSLSYHDASEVGYMQTYDSFTGATPSTTSKVEAQTNEKDSGAKLYLDNFYQNNIENNEYNKYVSDEIFCNDRTSYIDISGTTPGGGYGKVTTYFGPYVRLNGDNVDSPKPSFQCPQKNDAFTVKSTAKGNGALTYPIGLITADELVAAGSGKYGSLNSKFYLTKMNGYPLWTMSPAFFGSQAYMITSSQRSPLTESSGGNASIQIVPVINLTKEAVLKFSGDGTIANPFRIVD